MKLTGAEIRAFAEYIETAKAFCDADADDPKGMLKEKERILGLFGWVNEDVSTADFHKSENFAGPTPLPADLDGADLDGVFRPGRATYGLMDFGWAPDREGYLRRTPTLGTVHSLKVANPDFIGPSPAWLYPEDVFLAPTPPVEEMFPPGIDGIIAEQKAMSRMVTNTFRCPHCNFKLAVEK